MESSLGVGMQPKTDSAGVQICLHKAAVWPTSRNLSQVQAVDDKLLFALGRTSRSP